MTTSYDWVREIKPETLALDEVPLTGNAPAFPWDKLSQRLAKSLEREGLEIKPGELTWRSKEQLFEGLGGSPSPLIFSVPSLRGEICWVMPEQEMTVLESLLLTKESHPITFQDRALSESFYRFLALEVLYNLTQIPFDKTMAPLLTDDKTLPSEDSLCLDISLSIQQQTVWGRLIISPSLRKSWVEHFAHQGHTVLTEKMSGLIDMTVHLEAGKMNLSLKEWNSITKGDFLILDSCSLESNSPSEGRLTLTISGKQAFRGKLKDGNIKILEFPFINEVNTPMSKNEDEDDLSDLDLTDDEHLTSDGALDEDDLLEGETSAPAEKTAAPKAAPAPTNGAVRGTIDPENIPVSLTIEVGRIQMSVEKLLKLEPGNMLELNVRPEDGVDLTINGRVVGKGELIKVGETLGIRVLELGK